jgi:adenosine deaminase
MKPLVDLHLHLDGSLRLQTMLDIALRERVTLPAFDKRGLKRALRCGKVRKDLEDYLSAFPITLSVLQSRYALERVTAELLEDCAQEGLKYVEIRFSPLLHMECDMTASDAVEAVLRGVERGMKFGIRANVILCSLRHFDPLKSELLVCLALAYRNLHGGVVGVDLAGDDLNYESRRHGRAFQWAKDRGLGVTIHAGEAGPWDRVIDALSLFRADRIGHGVRAIDNSLVLDLLSASGTAIETCLTSNVQTRAAANYWSHPARAYLKQGLNVTLNTDNRLLAGTTLAWEYNLALLHWAELDKAGVRQLQWNAINAAFAPTDWKVELYQALDAPP